MSSWRDEVGSDGKRKSTDGYKVHDNVDEDGFIKATDTVRVAYMIRIALPAY